MDKVQAGLTALEEFGNGIPEFKKQCDKNGVNTGHALAGIIGVSSVLLLWFQGLAMISALVTCVYPMIQSINAIQNQ